MLLQLPREEKGKVANSVLVIRASTQKRHVTYQNSLAKARHTAITDIKTGKDVYYVPREYRAGNISLSLMTNQITTLKRRGSRERRGGG